MKTVNFSRNPFRRHSLFRPATPYSALRAARAGIISVDEFLNKAASISPLSERPYNLAEIQRLLALSDRDLTTNRLLMSILQELVRDEDPETALFAAESIIAIQQEYAEKLERLAPGEEEGREDEIRQRAEIFFDLALLHTGEEGLKRFYCRESFFRYRRLEAEGLLDDADKKRIIRIMMELELFSQARSLLGRADTRDPDFLLLEAEMAFREQDYSQVFDTLRRLESSGALDWETRSLLSFWFGSGPGPQSQEEP